jgi:hypothetical protein
MTETARKSVLMDIYYRKAGFAHVVQI